MTVHPLQCVATLNVIADFFCNSVAAAVRLSWVSRHVRCALQQYCDAAWQRLGATKFVKKRRGDATVTTTEIDVDADRPLREVFLSAVRSSSAVAWVVRALCRGGIDANVALSQTAVNFSDSARPLTAAAMYGRRENVAALLGAGADPRARSEMGHSALSAAATNGHAAVCALLLAAGASANERGSAAVQAPLCAAAMNGREDVVRALLGSDDLDLSELGQEALAAARRSYSSRKEVIVGLIEDAIAEQQKSASA